MGESSTENPVAVRWRQVAEDLTKVKRRLDKAQAQYDDLVKTEQMLRGALQEAGVELPELAEIQPKKRRVSNVERAEDLILSVTRPGETVRADQLIERLGDRVPADWKNAGAAIRGAMRRSGSFVLVKRGIFRRVDGGVGPTETSEASPPEGNEASFIQ